MRKILPIIIILLLTVKGFGATWTIIDNNFTFTPDSLVISQGDTIIFSLAGIHNAQEVDQATWLLNNNSPVVGFQTGFGGGLVSGLSLGTHYYVCSPHSNLPMKGRIFVNPAPPAIVIPNVWINEIHYDNANTDSLEGYEIAGPAGTDLGCFRIFLYSGSTGTVYDTDTLSGIIPDLACGYGTIWFPKTTIQNGLNGGTGSPDGIAIEYASTALQCGVTNQDTILQFISYEGSFTALNGRAAGLSSTDIGASESASGSVINSLQLGGAGTSYAEFTWNPSAASTHDLVNHNQFFCGPPQASYSFVPLSAIFSEGSGTVVAGYVKALNIFLNPQSVDVAITSGSGTAADINNFVTQTLTFNPGGIDSLPLNITITNDLLVEGTENIVFALRNASLNGFVEADSLFDLTITDNDAAPNPSLGFIITSSSVNEGVGSYQLAVSITNPNANPTSVDINVLAGGTATPVADYFYSPITMTFPGGSLFNQIVTITIVDDGVAEGNENFTFQLNAPTNNATIGVNGSHTATITDNDTLLLDISPPAQIRPENTGLVNIPVLLNHISPNPTSVTLHLVPGGTTATAGADFQFNDTTITWAAGVMGIITVPIAIVDDTLYEQNETVRVLLTNPTNGASFLNDTFLLVIQNDDSMPSRECTDLFFSEYIEGTSFNKALEIFNPTPVPVDLSAYRIFKSVNGGTSTSVFGLSGILAPDSVYVAAHSSANVSILGRADTLSGFFNFTGNDALALLHHSDTIDIIGEFGIDPGTGWPVDTGSTIDHTLIRSFYTYYGDTAWGITAASWNGYAADMIDSLGFHSQAVCGTIPNTTVRFSKLSDTVVENSGIHAVEIRIDNPSARAVNFSVVRNDTASSATYTADYDYPDQIRSTSNRGTTFDTVYITVKEDQLIEPVESIVLHFINISPGLEIIADSSYTLNIIDNDTLTVSFLGAGFSYIEDTSLVEVKVTLSTFSGIADSVRVSLAAGSAEQGIDFTFTDTVLIFPANSIDTQSAWVRIIDDNLVEANEQINFNLTSLNSRRIGISAYTLIIIDNDSTVGIRMQDDERFISLAPNPVMSLLIVRTENEFANSEIIDLCGNAVLHTGKLSAGRNGIDVSDLPGGMYFFRINDGDKFMTRRFVKYD